MWETRNAHRILESPKGIDYLEDVGVNGRIILKQTSEKYGVRVWAGSSGSIRGWEFLD
jgi:hypothetical protein